MADREKVIKGLECCKNQTCDYARPDVICPYMGWPYRECTERLADDALILLKEHEPIKPIVSVDTWICPKCGHTLENQELIDDKENPQVLIHEQYQYCPNCGRAVKWDE